MFLYSKIKYKIKYKVDASIGSVPSLYLKNGPKGMSALGYIYQITWNPF